jgi:hypothetical protein
MNELSERDVEVCEHIRDTYAEFDPVPAEWRGASRNGAENMPRSRGAHKRSRDRRDPVVRSSPQLAAFGTGGFAPPHVIAVNSPRSTTDFTNPTGEYSSRPDRWPRSTPP